MALSSIGLPYRGPGSFAGKGGETKTYSGAYARLSQSGIIGRSKSTDYTTKEQSSAPGNTDRRARLGQLGLMGRIGGPYNTKISTPDTVIAYSNTHSLLLATYQYQVLQDRIIDYAGVELVTETFPYEIIQGGQTLSYSADALTFSGSVYDITQSNPNNREIVYTGPDALTFTAYPYTIAQDKIIDYDTKSINFATYSYDIIPGVLGDQTLTNADIQAIWRNPKFDGISPMGLMKIIAAATAGKAFENKERGTFGYMSVDGTKPRITATFDGPLRVIVTLDPD